MLEVSPYTVELMEIRNEEQSPKDQRKNIETNIYIYMYQQYDMMCFQNH